MKKTRCHPTKGDTVFCLVGDYAISENFIIANRVLIDAAAIAGVALDGVDNAVFDLLDDTDMVGLTVIKAVSAGIAVYAAHTNADKVAAGVSGAMAARLCLKDVEILDQDGDGTGLGVVGNLPEPMPASEFVYYVKKAFGLSSVRCSHLPEGEISRVAMCGGSGSSLIGKARSSGAQAYVSGDITYHHFFTPEDFLIVDIGHFEGEVDIVNILFSLIKKKFPTFAVRTSSGLAAGNPVLYF